MAEQEITREYPSINNLNFLMNHYEPRGVSQCVLDQDGDTLTFAVPSGKTVSGIFIMSNWELVDNPAQPCPIIGACQFNNYANKYTIINSGAGKRIGFYTSGITFSQEGTTLTVTVSNSTEAIFKAHTKYECYMRW